MDYGEELEESLKREKLLEVRLAKAKKFRGHAEAEVINGIREIQQLQVELALRKQSDELFATKIVPDLKAEVTGAYNRGYIKGLAEGRK